MPGCAASCWRRRRRCTGRTALEHDGQALGEDLPLQPLSPYALAKKHGEEMLRLWTSPIWDALDAVSLRFFNVFGPRQRRDSAYATCIERFLAQWRDRQPFTIVPDGQQRRDMVFVTDVVRAVRLALEAPGPFGGEVFNIGGGRNYSILEIADLHRRAGAPAHHDRAAPRRGARVARRYRPRPCAARMVAAGALRGRDRAAEARGRAGVRHAAPVRVGARSIGPRHPVFVICEAGVTNYGDRELAMRQIDAAVEAGADAVKFQCWRTEELVSKPVAARLAGELGYDWFDRLKTKELTYDDLRALQAYAAARGILFFVTPHDLPSLEFVDRELQVPLLKVGSGRRTTATSCARWAGPDARC